ncbi:MAG: hypothetical protein V1824_04805 [archaeon]
MNDKKKLEANLINQRFNMLKLHHTNTLKEAIDTKVVDEPIIPFLLEITKIPNIFTSSSCCGRVMLLISDEFENKKYSHFLERYHRLVNFEEIKEAISSSSKGEAWFKVEPFIFHFGCKDYKTAKKILLFARDFGLKKSGIINVKRGRYVIEVNNTSFISTIVKIDSKQLISDDYLKVLVDKANTKLDLNFKKLKDFEKKFLDEFLEVAKEE